MYKRSKIVILLAVSLLLLTGCSADNELKKPTIEISAVSTSIGAVGNNTSDTETQSFKYNITMINNGPEEIAIASVKPVLSDAFLERVPEGELAVQINKTIAPGGNLEVSGEIIFDAKGLTKEQIIGMEPFVKELEIIEARTIKRSF
ncbi:MAG: hypothetical protein ACM3ZR_14100 [Pseudomonadota bacterium]